MKTGRPSRTSEGTIAVRAREMRRPAEERICHDPFAVLPLPVYPQAPQVPLARHGLWLDEGSGLPRPRKLVQRVGEPFLFGIDDDEIEPFLRERGFREIQVVRASTCREARFGAVNRKMRVSDMFRLVQARHYC